MPSPTQASKAHGVVLGRGDGATPTEVFTPIAEITSLGGPPMDANAIDVSTHESAEGFREYVIGLIDAGEISLELNFLPGNATQNDTAGGMLNDLRTRQKSNYQITWPDVGTTQWTFEAYVTGFEPSADVDEALTATATLQITGAPTLA